MHWTLKPLPPGSNQWVMQYYEGWYWNWIQPASLAIAAVDMTTMTHLVFGRYAPGAGPAATGGQPGDLIPAAGTGHSQVEGPLIAKAHDYGKKAIMMIGGSADGGGWTNSTVDATTRAKLINNILTTCAAKGYDGCDVDWETSINQTNLIAFVEELRGAADAHPTWANNRFIVTFPAMCNNANTDNVQAYEVELGNLVDQFNIMSYGQNYAPYGWSSWFFAALKDGGKGTHPFAIEDNIDQFVLAGIPRSKMGMGIGFYGDGYASSAVTQMRVPNVTWVWGKSDSIDMWKQFYYSGVTSHAEEYVFDEVAQTGFYRFVPQYPYARWSGGNVVNISILTYEDERSIQAKGSWARGGGCGGVITWAYNLATVLIDGVYRNPAAEQVRDAFGI